MFTSYKLLIFASTYGLYPMRKARNPDLGGETSGWKLKNRQKNPKVSYTFGCKNKSSLGGGLLYRLRSPATEQSLGAGDNNIIWRLDGNYRISAGNQHLDNPVDRILLR
jgi:hypothetical protein